MSQAATLRFTTASILCVAALTQQAVAQEQAPKDPRVAVISKSIRSFAAAFNKADPVKLASHFSRDGEYMDAAGTLFRGRANIEAEFAAFFKATPGCQLSLQVSDIRFIGKSLAIEEGRATLSTNDNGPTTASRYVVVHTHNDGRWQIASARDLNSEPASNHDRLKSLEWLVGDWIDESDDSTVDTSFRWSENGNYLFRRFHIKTSGARVMNGTQRIGWDPQKRHIRSWVFDSEGGFGEGVWTETTSGWIVKSTFVLPNGSSGSATTTYARKGKDAFRMTVSQRLVAGKPLANLAVDVVRRPPAITR